MKKSETINVSGVEIRVTKFNDEDYICLTDTQSVMEESAAIPIDVHAHEVWEIRFTFLCP